MLIRPKLYLGNLQGGVTSSDEDLRQAWERCCGMYGTQHSLERSKAAKIDVET